MLLNSISQAAAFLKVNGYAVIPKFISPAKCQEAMDEIDRLVEAFQPTKDQITIFDTKSSSDSGRFTKYFLDSSDKISFFFESKAWKDDKLVVPKKQAINKVAHSLYDLNPVFKQITQTNGVHQICQLLGVNDPLVIQSMAILKPPKIGGLVGIHQDSTYLYSQPDTLLGFWIPLQDATVKNGCLWGLPGSHKSPLYSRSKVTKGVPYEQRYHQIDYKQQDFTPFEMQRGSLAVFTGKFLHKSHQNLSQLSRYAYTWHIIDSSSKWSADNWLQRASFPALSAKQGLN